MESIHNDGLGATSPEPGEQEQSIAAQWLGRVVITVILATLYHWWENSRAQPMSAGSPLEHDWNIVSANDDSMDGLDGNVSDLIYDDIDDDDENEGRKELLIYDDIEEEFDKNQSQGLCHAPSQTDEEEEGGERKNSSTPPMTTDPTHDEVADIRNVLQGSDSNHPGIGGFRLWYEIEASLYRIYSVGKKDRVEIHPPFVPKSERGHVSLKLKVTNNYLATISAYWIDYKGNEVHKGNVPNGGVFSQTTWIGHPWVFRDKATGALLCHYIPYQIISTTHQVPTIGPDEPDVGIHQFAILSPSRRKQANDDGSTCCIADPVFPTVIETLQDAAAWSFQEMARRDYPHVESLAKYLTNIVLHPTNTKYRRIRIANKRFSQHVWNTPARGILLAAGFVELNGFAELGCNDPLPRSRVQDLSTILFYLEKWKRIQDSPKPQQPQGADGSGRANYGQRYS